MAKTLLHSDNLDDCQAMGSGDQVVSDSALQACETLRLRKQQAMVGCLTIPQIDDNGDRVDRYSPIEGKTVTWKAVDEEVRFRALRYLGNILEDVVTLSRKSLQPGKTSLQPFGLLLEEAIQFPGGNHVLLVDGKPVITSWGLINLNENPCDGVLGCLRIADVPPTATIAEPGQEKEIAPGITFAEADVPLLTPVIDLPKPAEPEPHPSVVASEPEVTALPVHEKPICHLPLWNLSITAVIIAAIVGPLLWKQQTIQPVPAVTTIRVAKVDMAPLPVPTPVLPLHRAEVTPAAKKEKPVEGPMVIVAIPKNTLVMDANQMKVGATRFLNDNRHIMVDVRDPVNGKAPSLCHQIQVNKGTTCVVHGDNIICRAEIFLGLHRSGELMIKSHGNACCTDGSHYPMPETTCKAGTDDVAARTARYGDHTETLPTIKKVGA